ncbi:S-layer homology domain-containing protein [Fenollaria timonensis]|uniref:S-layer homology domain-containing protein n=1 Tax=Fenollaria timonensis TaxID=1723384 RepID=UPI00071C78AA|nr:S-layer homology domain-containing protein [Fenollaria timonensis]
MKKKIISLFLLLGLILSVIPLNSYAQFGPIVTGDDVDGWIKDNYWVELEKDGLNAVPIGVNPNKESKLGTNIKVDELYYPWLNTGIRTDRTALFDYFGDDGTIMAGGKKIVDDFRRLLNQDYDAFKDNNKPYNDWNEFNIDLNKDTIMNINDFNIYGDMYKINSVDSSSIDTYKNDSSMDLALTVDLSTLVKAENTYGLVMGISDGYLRGIGKKGNGYARKDDKFAFTLDFPKEAILTEDAEFEIEGLEGYNLKHEELRSNDSDRKKIIIYADEDNIKPTMNYIDFYNTLNKWNPNVTLKIKGIKFNNSIKNNKNYTITASIAGMYDIILSKNKSVLDNLKFNKTTDGIRRFVVFAAKQSNEGTDAAADKNKPNLISYTFNVEERKASHNPVVTFINNDRYYDEREVYEGTSINQNSYMPRDPEKRGYKFIEWNTMPDGSGMTFTGDTVVYEDMTVYAIYKKDRRYDDERETADEEPMLNINDHYQYMVGYKDATFRPNNNMTREEVAVMFSRLMVRRPIKGHIYNHNFKDLSNTRWSATAISYMNELGLIKGYPDGTFKPEKSITRAEFAAMATRFANLFGGGLQGFVDVPYTHWANDVIAKAASAGWVSGYPDGTFKPENKITRAEVVSITNRMLTRRADKDFITKHRSAILRFTDTPTHWAFYDIVEACNGHDYTRQGTIEENWLNVNLKTFVYDK